MTMKMNENNSQFIFVLSSSFTTSGPEIIPFFQKLFNDI